jgi:hypothetical protein
MTPVIALMLHGKHNEGLSYHDFYIFVTVFIGISILIFANTIVQELCRFKYVKEFCTLVRIFVNGYIILFYLAIIPFTCYQIYHGDILELNKSFFRWIEDCVMAWTLMSIYVLEGSIILFVVSVNILLVRLQQQSINENSYNKEYDCTHTTNSKVSITEQTMLNVFRWPIIVYFLISISLCYYLIQSGIENWTTPKKFTDAPVLSPVGGMLIGNIIGILLLLLLGTIFAAIMHGIFRAIKKCFTSYTSNLGRGMK